VSVRTVADPEQRAQRLIAARERRRVLLLLAPRALHPAAWVLALAAAGAMLYDWVVPPAVLLVLAVVAEVLARTTPRAAPTRLTDDDRALLTVREAWRELRADADVPRPYARHAVWVSEADDRTVQLWRLTRPAGEDYAITATLLDTLDALDTAAAAEATADARIAAERDEDAGSLLEATTLARALRA
jgi:hypothetical protein